MSACYGVRDDAGAIHHSLSVGDAENLAVQNDWQLVVNHGLGWQDVS